MNCLLLSAGFGKRLHPITINKPKCLVEVQGRPLLEHWLHKLNNLNIEKIYINTYFLSEQVENFVGNSEFNEKIVLLPESKLLGTAGTLINNIKSFMQDDLLIIIQMIHWPIY